MSIVQSIGLGGVWSFGAAAIVLVVALLGGLPFSGVAGTMFCVLLIIAGLCAFLVAVLS